MNSLDKAILNTLIYADIFDYPLTAFEIHKYLISEKPYSKSQLQTALKKLSLIKKHQGFYYLKTRKSITSLRKNRTRISNQKLKIAKKAANILKIIPSIQMITITGALSMKNSSQQDDIDLMIITKSNTLWFTRLFAIFLLELFGLRRRPHNSDPDQNNNKICLNLFLDQSSLALAKNSQNLYTAHEVVQVMPIITKNNTHQQFLSANSWVLKHLPNTIIPHSNSVPKYTQPSIFETLAFKLQYFYMKPKITNEKITQSSAFFHPRQTSKIVLDQYKKLQQLYL
ncbi:hypothetical protein ACFL18_01475 [Patescibacteria group bacterium]